jgi:hypothetical protein
MHVGKPESTSSSSCTFPFYDVPMWKSMGAEFLGSLLLGIAPGLIVEHPTMVILKTVISIFSCKSKL